MTDIISSYFSLCRKRHFFSDILITFLLILIINYISNLFCNSSIDTLNSILKIFIPILTFIASLHSSSLIFFANSSSDLVKKLKDEFIIKNHKKTTIPKINQIYSYFSWTILIQFISLIIFLLIVCIDFSMDNPETTINKFITVSHVLIFVISLGIYSMILSIRNTCIFFNILTWQPKK